MEPNQPPDLEEYYQLLNVVEAHLNQLTKEPLQKRLSTLTDIEKAKYKTLLSYAITTLQLCYLRTKGESVENHRNKKHNDRLKNYFIKLDRYIDLNPSLK